MLECVEASGTYCYDFLMDTFTIVQLLAIVIIGFAIRGAIRYGHELDRISEEPAQKTDMSGPSKEKD